MKKLSIVLIFLFFSTFLFSQQSKNTLSGFVKEKGSGELLIGASVAVPSQKTGTSSNNYGFFSITLPSDSIEVVVSYVGYKPKAFKVDLRKDVELNVILEKIDALEELIVRGSRQPTRIAQETRMSVIEIPIQQIKDIPALLGEKDVLKVIQLLPGVQKGREGDAGIYVRGGGPDQNLIILDDAIVYNAFHLFGFFSLFNGDALKSVELTKGGFPARYGGRLSSVIDMSMKEGSKEKVQGEAGVGIISSKMTIEGPIIPNKSSFLISGRRTYLDALIRPFLPVGIDVGYYFYDLNAKANYEIDEKNKLYVSGYLGSDRFFANFYDLGDKLESGINWGNISTTLRWNHVFNNKLFSNTSAIFSDYKFTVFAKTKAQGSNFVLQYLSGIQDYSIKQDYDYRPNPENTVKFGGQIIHHIFTPSAFVFKDDFNGINETRGSNLLSLESGVYIEDEIKVNERLNVSPGLRATHFGVSSQNYFGIEPRFSARYLIKPDLSAKASYALMNQYVHLISNTNVGLPTDLWVPSTPNLKPELSQQVAAGLAKDFLESDYSVSLEGYYKASQNIIAYKEGASFMGVDPDELFNSQTLNWEKNITSGKGWSYGAEVFLQKKIGQLNGWIGYTLSWTQMQFDDLNYGKKFYAKYDRRHDISVVAIYKVLEEKKGKNGVTLSGTWVYGTGNAITLPIAQYYAPDHDPSQLPYPIMATQYTGRNQFRMSAYHRLDVAIQIHKKFEKTTRIWELGLYNAYSRQNPFFYYVGYVDTPRGSGNALKQVSLFPLIPSISWNIKF